MRVFVASWFFPPATSSEGIVTYKLLRNSGYQYDVFSSSSKQWGYKADMKRMDEKNIETFAIETDSIDEWVEWCIDQFDQMYESRKYDCIMTRSTPPESILVGDTIKKKYPDIKWIASLADPVAGNPYELKAYIDDCPTLSDNQKIYLRNAIRDNKEELLDEWEKRPEAGVKLLCKLKRWENIVLKNADMIISPSVRQLKYILNDRGWNDRFVAVPHSYDTDFYNTVSGKADNSGKKVLSFLGYSDKLRSLKPLIMAVKQLKEEDSPFLKALDIRIIGNNPRELQDMVINYYLDDYIHFLPGVDYYKSLELMQNSDWLIHVDAFFVGLIPGGSIFFAGKLADYMGTGKPILALTGKGTPADQIVTRYGGESLESHNIDGIASILEKIACGYVAEVHEEFRKMYDARSVAARFDEKLKDLCDNTYAVKRSVWPEAAESKEEKLLSVCVPSYNVQKYLDRCLYSLVNHDMAGYIEVLVVDDGSKDHTADIGREYERRYPGIVRLLSKENGGHGSTINLAIQEAKGRYFKTVDGDDWVDSIQLASLLKELQEEKLDADVISSNYHEINIESAELTPVEQGEPVEFGRNYSFSELNLEKIYLTLASMTIKTSVLREMHVKLQEHTFYVDVEFILFPVPYIHTIAFTKHFIYKYARGNAEQSVALPNMVRRYDHHNRVMHRVIAYEKKVTLDAGQRDYYDCILKRLLFTHYGLGLIYDTDIVQGCARAKEFDSYLKQVRPDLYTWIGKEMRTVAFARRANYDPWKFKHSLTMAIEKTGEKLLNEIYLSGVRLARSDFARKIVYNDMTVSIAQSHFFTEGVGKSLKDKVNTLFGM